MSVFAFDYCGFNPVMYVDFTGDKSKLAIFTIYDFRKESKEIKKILSKIFPSNSTNIYNYEGTQNFIETWNKLSGYDVIIINAHGSPHSVMYIEKGIINSSKSGMEKIKCKLLIILGCNCGHYDYRKSNVAYCFSRKVSGIVIASDGTVYSSRSYGSLVFKSIADKTYLSYCRRRTHPNKGWLIYEYKNKNKKCYISTTPYQSLSFKSLISYLRMIKKF